MAYPLLDLRRMSEAALRELWRREYCALPVYTYDGIRIKFFEEQFDHAFYESAHHKHKDKSVLSFSRLEKMLWIKEILADPCLPLVQGWNAKGKCYQTQRRVAIAPEDYVVIIWLKNNQEGKFITAYQATTSIGKIRKSPLWKGL